MILALLSVLGTLRVQREAIRWVNHTQEVRERIDRTLALLTDAETGQRGYLLTGDKGFLKPYKTAVAAIPDTLDNLEQLTVDNDQQQRALKAVRSEVKNKIDALVETIVLTDLGQSAAALAIVRSGRGAATMDRLRTDLATMRNVEDHLLMQRSARAREANYWTIAAVVAMGAMAVLLLWLLRILMARDAAWIRENEERLATTVASVGDGVIATDSHGNVERMNPVAEQWTGWSLPEARGKPLDTVFHIVNEHTREPIESPHLKVLREGKVVGLADNTILIGKDGTERPIEDSSAPIRRADGTMTGVVLVFKDATQRYAAERQLRESDERFRTLADNIPQLAWIADAGTEGQVHWFNQNWFEYTGTTLEQMRGSGWHAVHHPEHSARVIQKFAHHVKEGMDWEDTFPLRGKDGEYRWFLSRMNCIRDESGRVVRIFGTNTDITQHRQMEDELTRLNLELETRVEGRTAELTRALEELKTETAERTSAEAQVRQLQKMEAIGQLTGGVAHDFNNMLAIVIGSLDQAKRRLRDDPVRALRRIETAEEGARRAAQLTARLLAFSRQQALAPEPLDANKLVAGMSELLRRTIGEELRVETVLAGGLWRTHADPVEVENAILNLCVNARDAMPGGGRLTIETANTHLDDSYASAHMDVPAGQYVLIAVTDTGTGMPPEVVERAFDPFYTTKGVGKGTGLGLSQVYGFIKQSNGHVKIYSEPGQGTTVKIYLPRYFGAALGTVTADDEMESEMPHAMPGEVILVVEDETFVRHVAVDSLRPLGYTVLQAADGNQALEILGTQPRVDLLFTDVVMPDMNGRQLADEAVKRSPNLKVIFTTGYTRNAVVHNGQIDPGVAFLQKPFQPSTLARKIRAVLDGHGAKRG